MTDPHPAALTPEQAARKLAYDVAWGLDEDTACYLMQDIANAIRSAVLAEREACAKVAEDASANSERGEHPRHEHIGAIGYECACDDIAEAIRARSTETDHDR